MSGSREDRRAVAAADRIAVHRDGGACVTGSRPDDDLGDLIGNRHCVSGLVGGEAQRNSLSPGAVTGDGRYASGNKPMPRARCTASILLRAFSCSKILRK